jgi:hypothetical protein
MADEKDNAPRRKTLDELTNQERRDREKSA